MGGVACELLHGLGAGGRDGGGDLGGVRAGCDLLAGVEDVGGIVADRALVLDFLRLWLH